MVDCMESKLSFARELKDKFIFLNSFPVIYYLGYLLNLHQRAAVLIGKTPIKKKVMKLIKYKGVSVLNKIRFARKVFLC
jgi:hypothetical protein